MKFKFPQIRRIVPKTFDNEPVSRISLHISTKASGFLWVVYSHSFDCEEANENVIYQKNSSIYLSVDLTNLIDCFDI